MANPFVKAWRYFLAAFSSKIDENADPKVQIQQAIEDAQRQHQTLSQQAASVIGNQRQLEMKLNRQLADIEKLQASARQALVMSDDARSKGDEESARRYEQSAEQFASQLVTAEQNVEDLKTLHDQSIGAAQQAKQAVERNAKMLQQKIAERTKLLSQLEQAKMQEQVSASLRSMSEVAAPGNTPVARRGARQDRAAVLHRARVRRSSRRTACRAGCSRWRSRPATSRARAASTRSAPRWAAARRSRPGRRPSRRSSRRSRRRPSPPRRSSPRRTRRLRASTECASTSGRAPVPEVIRAGPL